VPSDYSLPPVSVHRRAPLSLCLVVREPILQQKTPEIPRAHYTAHIPPMATQSGLTRRRGGGGGAASNGDDEDRVASPVPRARNDDRTPATSYENSANGDRIAFDPRDISESAERNKQPKLTLMEEVILMGLKDKQVRAGRSARRVSTD
jgi:hypothetical protein